MTPIREKYRIIIMRFLTTSYPELENTSMKLDDAMSDNPINDAVPMERISGISVGMGFYLLRGQVRYQPGQAWCFDRYHRTHLHLPALHHI